MKKTAGFIMAATVALASVFALSGCSVMSSVTYANEERYSVGNAEITDRIESIEVDWPSGSVNIDSHSESTFLLSEKAEDGLSDDLRVHWWLEGTTIHIKFAKSGANLWLFGAGHKELTLTVPETVSFNDISIHSASAEINAGGLAADTLGISTASGNMTVDCTANTVKLNSASGNIKLTQTGEAGVIDMETASGTIEAKLGQAEKADAKSASGKINIVADSIGSLSANAVSGAVFCNLATEPSECKLYAVSGEVSLLLPDFPNFTAKITTVSGNFESDFALKKNDNTYICGSGDRSFDIETVSGDVLILKKF